MSELSDAIIEMGRAVQAIRLEVPKAVADDVAARWRSVLIALDACAPDEVNEEEES